MRPESIREPRKYTHTFEKGGSCGEKFTWPIRGTALHIDQADTKEGRRSHRSDRHTVAAGPPNRCEVKHCWDLKHISSPGGRRDG